MREVRLSRAQPLHAWTTRPASRYRGWPRRFVPPRFAAAALLCSALALMGCQESPAAFGTTRALARTHADEVLEGLRQRFTNVDRSPAASASLAKVDRAIFSPSQIFEDTAVWTAVRADSVRALLLAGHTTHDRYVIVQVAAAPIPHDLAASRDEIRLAQVEHNQYEWSSAVDQVLGALTPDDVDRVIHATLAAPALAERGDLGAATVAAFPRSSEVLAQLFSLDTARTTPREDSTARLDVVIGVHPDRLAPRYPAFARYLHSYLGPLRFRCVLRDAAGGEWLEADFASSRLRLRTRTDRDGHFAPIDGPRRTMPDSLVLESDFRTKVWLFSIGMSGLTGDVLLSHAPRTLSWQFRFHQEPRWHLPLAVSHLVRGSLKRPFAGDGAQYRVLVTNSVDDKTVLQRDGDVTLQESAIMHWLGGIGARAFSEFAGPAEEQESAYLAEIFTAAREDVDSDLAAPATVAGDVVSPHR